MKIKTIYRWLLSLMLMIATATASLGGNSGFAVPYKTSGSLGDFSFWKFPDLFGLERLIQKPDNRVAYYVLQDPYSYTGRIGEAPNYLTFTGNGSVGFDTDNLLQYSDDGGATWADLTSAKVSIPTDGLLVRGNNPEGLNDGAFTMSDGASISVSGSVMSLIDGVGVSTEIPVKKCFSYLFNQCEGLVSAKDLELPATTLAEECYSNMFYGCTSLTEAPELPATVLVGNCYNGMFSGCTSLTKAPELPATTLAEECYSYMFYGCTSLTEAPELPATVLAEYCYYEMFYGCTSLTEAPALPATVLVVNCYNGMFSGCTNLTEAPALPATALADGCYFEMFNSCSKLNKLTVPFTDWNESGIAPWTGSLMPPPPVPSSVLLHWIGRSSMSRIFLPDGILISRSTLPPMWIWRNSAMSS